MLQRCELSATAVGARQPYSRTSFERVGHAVGALYRGASGHIEEALIEAYEVPPVARSVSVSIDRVSLPMEELPPAISLPTSPRGDTRRASARGQGVTRAATACLALS